ncbi:carboxypeptidase-like regulatory domain-containing protein [Hymenobacter sp. 15J16-1T3B]|uniref:carboxypeptidase-like regulatory domain-containing protein n=1 Tax=Hymenobacter sp. 15J16-1T3B TaxID=2886941 RepID=UPI001D0F9978|nr:carboxypeptidase-like regulatory domain-containing protein [Hymenobacter sp. 15J16-1T3B]MCC3159814.1 carboxypeptidase-like regulatory domain-containing protein [Hymenobacter sp. 15J16-1T3B]
MRHLASFLAALFFAMAAFSSAVAADAPARKASTVKPAKGVSKTAAVAPTRLKATLVAPSSDILHEHFAVRVAGTITAPDGQPLPGATIWKTNTREILAVTNSQGDFTLTLPTNARVTLTCGYAGYEDQQLMLSQPQRNNLYVISLERQK